MIRSKLQRKRVRPVNQQSSANRWDTVAIIGVGLIGGSIGMTLRKRGLARIVVGVGRTEERLRIAHERGAVTSTTTDLACGVRDADSDGEPDIVITRCRITMGITGQVAPAAIAEIPIIEIRRFAARNVG